MERFRITARHDEFEAADELTGYDSINDATVAAMSAGLAMLSDEVALRLASANLSLGLEDQRGSLRRTILINIQIRISDD